MTRALLGYAVALSMDIMFYGLILGIIAVPLIMVLTISRRGAANPAALGVLRDENGRTLVRRWGRNAVDPWWQSGAILLAAMTVVGAVALLLDAMHQEFASLWLASLLYVVVSFTISLWLGPSNTPVLFAKAYGSRTSHMLWGTPANMEFTDFDAVVEGAPAQSVDEPRWALSFLPSGIV